MPPRRFSEKQCNEPPRRRLTDEVNPDFKILIEFLDRLGPEVSARQLSQPHSEEAAKLERFARGECTDAERAAVCNMLRLHPAWLRWLADRVKLSRPATSGPDALQPRF